MSYPFKFLTAKSMAAIKQDDAKRNSYYKRGEFVEPKHSAHCMCGCDFAEKDATCHFVTDLGKYVAPKQPPAPPKPKKKL